MPRFKAVIEYDGTDFHGFQRQASGRTVQGEIEAALARMNAGRAVTVYGAGRTDSGVHARGQVVAFDLAWRHGTRVLLRALNANLARDVAARAVEQVADGFHPRFAARSRRYEYRIYNARIRSPAYERAAWHVWPPLDVDAMRAAARALVGEHDFASFGAAPDGKSNTVRTVYRAQWDVTEPLVVFEIAANAFLYHMVRSIVGSLRQVGHGELSQEQFTQRLAAADRSQAGPLAPPNGLTLVEVIFED